MNRLFERTRVQYLQQLNKEDLTPKQKKIFSAILKKLNLSDIYRRWVTNGRDDDGFQELVADKIKHVANKYLKDQQEEVEQIALNIAYSVR